MRKHKAKVEYDNLKKTRVLKWYKNFLGDQETYQRRPWTSMTEENIGVVLRFIEGDHRLSVPEFAYEIGISSSLVMILATERYQRRIHMSQQLLIYYQFDGDISLQWIFTWDEILGPPLFSRNYEMEKGRPKLDSRLFLDRYL